ncbi:MAG: hypothetical protein GX320_03365 [Tissierellia bacterium]|nr:hypothetical protein [Tissierellia bacterium]
MKNFLRRSKLNFVIMAIVYIVFGLMFIIRPDTTNRLIVTILGILITLVGISKILSHMRAETYQRFESFSLGTGIIILLIGLYFLIKPETIVSILGAILGFFLFFHGAINFQHAFNLKGMDYEKWWASAIFGIIAIFFGFYGVLNPTAITPAFSIVIGLGMIISGITDIFMVYKISSYFK